MHLFSGLPISRRKPSFLLGPWPFFLPFSHGSKKSFSVLPLPGISLHPSAVEQTVVQTRATPRAAKQQQWPPEEVPGQTGRTHMQSEGDDPSYLKRWSHGRSLSTRRPSYQPGALPSLGLVFISGPAVDF
uniref:Uncharacterized protein n=1 Tax=Marmota marmota marmota TaxID=9994 RepID=A0A8C5ZI46_MARMA